MNYLKSLSTITELSAQRLHYARFSSISNKLPLTSESNHTEEESPNYREFIGNSYPIPRREYAAPNSQQSQPSHQQQKITEMEDSSQRLEQIKTKMRDLLD